MIANTLIALIKKTCTGGAYWPLEPKTDIFFFYTFGGDRLKSLIIQDNKKVIENIWDKTDMDKQ